MFRDNFDRSILDSESLAISAKADMEVRMADSDEKKHWQVTDVITHVDGSVEVREYVNTVVDNCSKLIASLMKGHAGHVGISYWAVGSGAGSWDNNNPPAPSVTDTKLTTEVFRKAISPSNITFLDDSNQPTATVTNKLQVKLVFNENEANGELREFGLYGGNATSIKDSGIMINRKTHGLLYKTSGMTLERTINITF